MTRRIPRNYRVIRRHVRLPFGDLVTFITIHHGSDPVVDAGFTTPIDGHHQSVSRVATLTDTHRRTVQHWMRHDVPYFAADKAALALDAHPENIWLGFSELEPYVYERRPLCS